MGQYLTCVVYAPIAAMGALVSGANRFGWERPARSALLGIVAAGLGIDARDDDALLYLQDDVGLAMLVERTGTAFVDYHTTRQPAGNARKTASYATLRDEIAAITSGGAILSYREYRTDVCVLLALWRRTQRCRSLDNIASALRHPAYALYFGRAACPLGLPLAPVLIEAASPIAALLQRHQHGPERDLLPPKSRWAQDPYLSLDPEDVPDGADHQIEVRADRLTSRVRWQFAPRVEAIIRLPKPSGAAL